MKVLVCNVGSTSLKYQLIKMPEESSMARGKIERVGFSNSIYSHNDIKGQDFIIEENIPDYKSGIKLMIKSLLNNGSGVIKDLKEISTVGFKVVHAKNVTGVRILNDHVINAMEDYNGIAPAHNPPYINAIRQFKEILPETPLVGSFETTFHKNIPPEAYLYGIPYGLYEKHSIRKYGFHGASHEFVSQKVFEKMGKKNIKLITCHLGGSGSLCAIKNGESIDTTMGFSLQTGILHNNRCGDIDPFIPIYLMEDLGYSLKKVKELLTKESGLLGLSGYSNDLRDIEKAAEDGEPKAKHAIDTYCYQIKKYIGSYTFAMGGLDAIAFAGGIGENGIKFREKICSNLEFAGIILDKERNIITGKDATISTNESKVKVYIIPTDEEIIIARKAFNHINNK